MILCAMMMALGPIWVEAPAFEQPWSTPPARFEVGDSIGAVRVTDETTGLEVPCKVQQHRDKRYVYWVRTEDGSASHRYRIDPLEPPTLPPPAFAGAGDMMDYGRPQVKADLGVGLWATALPLDWDNDGDWDLLYSCQDVPQSGVYVYLQVQPGVFEQAARLGDGVWYPALADMNGDGREDLLLGEAWCDDVRANGLAKRSDGPLKRPEYKVRSFMARQADWDGDGVLDLIAAAGDWREYGWDRGFDEQGIWTRGPLHGPLWFHKNTGTNEAPQFAEGVVLRADDKPIDIYGSPCPCIADWDGDGDLDILCGEFRDEFTYFENVGGPRVPRLAPPRPVMSTRGKLRADLCMISPMACDWNRDGRPDLVVGQEDGRVSVILNRGLLHGAPQFAEEHFLKELDPPIKSGGLVTPWLDATTRDLYCGNTAGYVERFLWRMDGYREGRYLRIGNDPLRIQAGYNGSVQGPAEEKWGYTVPTLGDLNNDGQDELVYNSIIGRIEWAELLGSQDRVAVPLPVRVAWLDTVPYPAWNWWKPGSTELVVEWRTRPLVVDWDRDGSNDLVAVDHEGYLALYRFVDTSLLPGERVFHGEDGAPLRLNEREGGGSGRAKIHLADWDGDGDLDLIRNTQNAGWFENTGDATFVWRGDFPCRKLAGHTTAPQAVDWNEDGVLDLIVGAEDGHIYCYHRAAIEEPDRLDALPAGE
ncbi:MAG: VCBS repeat-containing protein [Candidatus Hydrogenedentes bacterium]|nr:VCBS repeat-containing protein [Candidatus Hydrogenedentota bacterium]